ncbi:hypothetical protein [Sphingobium sp. C100]|jgi:hypothetical protein|uniref:hypothetical protein n=1 Tax=Sphingobium sp. C100 TaxID=1207055 RepID=UPI001377745F|nr:hypothetical protein [Sphingobium sp. C100]
MIAENAIGVPRFAFATIDAAPQKERAFQASSPKTSKLPFRVAFFLLFFGRRFCQTP